MRNLGWKIFALAAVIRLSATTVSWAADCVKCGVHVAELRDLQQEKRRSTDLLGKNNEYLAVLTAEQASKFLKVKSNITVILRKLEEINAKISATEKKLEQEGCGACEKGTS